MSRDYDQFDLAEMLTLFKDKLPFLEEVHKELIKFNEREEKLEIEHKVDVDLTDVKGDFNVLNSVEVNDMKELIEDVKSLKEAITAQELNPEIHVESPKVTVKLDKLESALKTLADKEVKINVKEQKVDFPTRAKDALPVKLVSSDGKRFYDAQSSGGGGIGKLANVSIVESTEQAGVFGFVVLNPDGTSLSAGGTVAPAVDNLLLETGDNLLLETGDLLLTE